MKSSLMRPAIMLALALSLASCGGKAGFTVAGTVTGQLYPGLVLTTNNMDVTVDAPAPPLTTVNFSFPKQIEYGDVYDVTVKQQPQHQTCVPIVNGSPSTMLATDTAGRLAQINVPFSCTLNAFAIGGTVSGLTADGLVLANGSTGGSVTLAKGATAFALPSVPFGVTYGVTVQTQPTGLVCSVGSKGTGVMGDAAVADIAVTCVPQT
jgi:hypothetical protein